MFVLHKHSKPWPDRTCWFLQATRNCRELCSALSNGCPFNLLLPQGIVVHGRLGALMLTLQRRLWLFSLCLVFASLCPKVQRRATRLGFIGGCSAESRAMVDSQASTSVLDCQLPIRGIFLKVNRFSPNREASLISMAVPFTARVGNGPNFKA